MSNFALRYKDYMNMFSLGKRTAERWIAEDRRKTGKKRLLLTDIAPIYGMALDDYQNQPKPAKTSQK
ncbi:MAG: hypothetical protein EOP56_13635 [Sphingobacteriales bacterium]|nr:MAG: hypothetical protein EOP56_13635 [Sphingobacteriales bacterium]